MAVNRYIAGRPAVLGLAKIFLLVASAHIPAISAAPTSFHANTNTNNATLSESKSTPDLGIWLYLGFAAALVLSGGAFAGLTIALMGQDEVYLQVIKSSGEGNERKNADSVLSLLNKGKHWVLVTLLLSNVITNETLPIVLDRSLGGGWSAVLGSTTLIVIFGEIVPQSICVRYGLPIGAWLAPAVKVLMYLTSPIAWPVAKLLDRLLGEDHGTTYKKAGLKTLVTLHKNLGKAGEQLNSDEVTIITAVLDLRAKAVGSIMTRMDSVFTMSTDTVLDEDTMDSILSQGYSRIPIHTPDNPSNFVGMLLVKMLITYDPEDGKKVSDFALATLPETRPETSCLDIVNFFQEGKSHMVLVSQSPGEDHGALGVVTLEDVIEELIGEEIIDESDVFVDVHKAIRRMTPAPKSRVPKHRVVEDPAMMGEGELLNADGEQSVHSSRRRSSVEAPPPRFQLRVPNYDKDPASSSRWIKHVGTTDEIREHLKHLGPSNLASRPRQTRYQNVKIKRSNTADFEPAQGTSDSQPPIPVMAPLLLPSNASTNAGASDYGTLSAEGPSNKILGNGTDANTNGLAAQDISRTIIQEADNEDDTTITPTKTTTTTTTASPTPTTPTNQQHHRPDSSQSGAAESIQSTDSASALKRDDSNQPILYQRTGPARSGSITEQVVDVNGVRKVVLHTNSSSDTEESSTANKHSDRDRGRDSRGRDRDRDRDRGRKNTNANANENASSAHHTGTEGVVNRDTESETPKKKRRRKRRNVKSNSNSNSNSKDEEQPLLGQK